MYSTHTLWEFGDGYCRAFWDELSQDTPHALVNESVWVAGVYKDLPGWLAVHIHAALSSVVRDELSQGKPHSGE